MVGGGAHHWIHTRKTAGSIFVAPVHGRYREQEKEKYGYSSFPVALTRSDAVVAVEERFAASRIEEADPSCDMAGRAAANYNLDYCIAGLI